MTSLWRPFVRADLPRVLEFAGQCYREGGYSDTHPGDIVHHLSNGMRGQNIENGLRLYAENGELRAVAVIENEKLHIYRTIIHPVLWDTPTERALYAEIEQELLRLAPFVPPEKPEENPEPPSWWVAACDNDPRRNALLRKMGYVISEKPFMIGTLRDLENIPPSILPEGFTIRSSTEADAEQLCAVHSGAFGSKWTPAEYLNVMRTPGFDPARERIVVAPDGRFAAFCIYWPDPISKAAEFEPVGCHVDFQRHGLTRALMYDTMRLMRAAGMTHAVVIHQVEADNPASAGLYRAAGFQHNYGIYDATKPIS
jgi:ribosomal protein S18 acetylase RimI-like enzyme